MRKEYIDRKDLPLYLAEVVKRMSLDEIAKSETVKTKRVVRIEIEDFDYSCDSEVSVNARTIYEEKMVIDGIHDKPESIGDAISKQRKKANETQEDVAKALGVSREVVKAWELNERKVKAEALIALADHFHVSIDRLIGREWIYDE